MFTAGAARGERGEAEDSGNKRMTRQSVEASARCESGACHQFAPRYVSIAVAEAVPSGSGLFQ